MTGSNDAHRFLLRGLDGANPLGFLAAVGVVTLLDGDGHGERRDVRLGWEETSEGWRPSLQAFARDEHDLCERLELLLKSAPVAPLEIGRTAKGKGVADRFPFSAGRFRDALKARAKSKAARYEADLLAAFGSDTYPDGDEFQCTAFKMVRKGDSNDQGMLHYAKAIRRQVDAGVVERTLFEPWDYQYVGYSLRWDPIETQSYALRYRDPSKSRPGSMPAANSFAFEALQCMPCVLVGTKLRTTGFQNLERQEHFVWPIWTAHLALATVRSLLSLGELHRLPLDRRALAIRGIADVFRAAVIRPNQYYRNFAPAQPAP